MTNHRARTQQQDEYFCSACTKRWAVDEEEPRCGKGPDPMTETQITQADRDAYAAALEKMKYARSADAVRNGFEDKHPIVQAFAAHRTNRTDATPWMPIASAPKDAMILSRADGMIRLVMWEDGEWAQVGATIEVGWFEPDEWMPIPDATHPPATDVAALVEENARLRQALEDVVNPMSMIQRQAEAEGNQLSGMAYYIANDLGFVQTIAKRALAPFTKGQNDD